VATVVAGEPIYPAVVKIDPTYISKILGFEVSNADVARILRLIGCDVDEKSWTVDPPSWRADLVGVEDVPAASRLPQFFDALDIKSKSASGFIPDERLQRAAEKITIYPALLPMTLTEDIGIAADLLI
jgi:hypothetical protein